MTNVGPNLPDKSNHRLNSRRSWLIWGVALFAYTVAVTQRTSLGVAGIEAAHRLDITASALSILAVVQLGVYAALQIPTGMLVDRVGPKVLIASGALLMSAGQITLALAPSIGVAIVGRILVGAGDALTFISVIRLLSSWFGGRLLPQISQWTGNIGQLGQVVSAVPFSLVLHGFGWSPAFVSAGALSVLTAVLASLLLSNGAKKTRPAIASTGLITTVTGSITTMTGSFSLPGGARRSLTPIRQLRESMARPGTQLGFWSHFVTQSSGTVFSLLWGFPMLTAGLGYPASTASAMLALIVFSGMISGPILGILSARHPMRRSNIVLSIVAMIGVAWTAVLAWPGHPPFWLVVTLVVILGIGGPGSLIGFDYARTFNPMRSLGSANGVVNVGGFLASFVMIYLIGLVLDLQDNVRVAAGASSDLYAWDSFRIALLVQYLIIGGGLVFLLRARALTRRGLRADEGIEVAPLWVALVRRCKHRRGNRPT